MGEGYGLWDNQLTLNGIQYRAEQVAVEYAKRAGFSQIYAVDGVPPEHEAAIVRAAQVSDVPHTWRIKQAESEAEVTSDVIEQGKAALRRDQSELNAHIIVYLGRNDSAPSNWEFLAAGAIRNKLTRNYESDEFPVISRAVVSPGYRGMGLGSLIVEHRVKAALRYFGTPPKAIHFGTESQKILHSVRNVEAELGFHFVYIGDEHYSAHDGTHVVHDLLAFLPWYKDALLNAARHLGVVTKQPGGAELLTKHLNLFIRSGVRGVMGADLERSFRVLEGVVQSSSSDEVTADALSLFNELFLVRKTIGAEDPAELPSFDR